MEFFPSALVIASYDSVCHNNNMLYRLVRPVPEGIGVQSTDRMVNVVPFRRKYIFERKQELHEFGQQMLRRPLVLQPVLHFGRGLGNNCALSYQDELWLVMVNQTHPKILSRLQMGLDSAKGAIERGQPFEIKFRFGNLIQRVYQEHLTQKELNEAQKSNSIFGQCMTNFRFVEWEHCDLILRHYGYGALHSLPKLNVTWDFEDIGMQEMEWRQPSDVVYPKNICLQFLKKDLSCSARTPLHRKISAAVHKLRSTSEGHRYEIREHLPGWTINGVSPLDYIGDSIPENNYDYAQAGRLYASFRKKRHHQNTSQHNSIPSSSYNNDYADELYQEEDLHEELVGAVGHDPSGDADFVNPDDYTADYYDTDHYTPPSQSEHGYRDADNHHKGSKLDYQNNNHSLQQHSSSNYSTDYSGSRAKRQPTSNTEYVKSQPSNQSKSSVSQPDKYGHIHANVEIVSKASSQHDQKKSPPNQASYAEPHAGSYNTNIPPVSDYHPYTDPFKKQDSDRFSRSTNADSGYCPDGDDLHSRGGSYDYNEQGYMPKHKEDRHGYGGDVLDHDGLENPAFRYDYHDKQSGLQRQELNVSKLVEVPLGGNKIKRSTGLLHDHTLDSTNYHPQKHHTLSTKGLSADVMKAPPRQKKHAAVRSSGVPQVAESYI